MILEPKATFIFKSAGINGTSNQNTKYLHIQDSGFRQGCLLYRVFEMVLRFAITLLKKKKEMVQDP